jgi:hypothetical protein
MSKYRIAGTVDAVEWTGKNEREMFDFLTQSNDENFRVNLCNGACQTGNLYINTPIGEVKVNIGDYVIKVAEEVYLSFDPYSFNKCYEKVED